MVRRLRAIAVLALGWGLAWAAIGTPLNLLVAMIANGGGLRGLLAGVPLVALAYGTFGAVSGAGFALMTMLAERNRSLEDLSPKRLALWGGLGGALLPLFGVGIVSFVGGSVIGFSINVLPLFGVILISGTLGAAFAAGQLRIASALPTESTPALIGDKAAV